MTKRAVKLNRHLLSPTALVLSRRVGACTQQQQQPPPQPPPLSSPASLPLLNSASCNFLPPHSRRCFLLTHITPARPKVYRGGGGRCSCHIRETSVPTSEAQFLKKLSPRACPQTFFPLPLLLLLLLLPLLAVTTFLFCPLPRMARLTTGTCGWMFPPPPLPLPLPQEAAAFTSA